MASEEWDHGNPMWEAFYFTKTEIEAFHAVRALTEGVAHRRRTTTFKRAQVTSKAFKSFRLTSNPYGEAGEWKLLLREDQFVPYTPHRLSHKNFVTVRHVLAVTELVCGKEFLHKTYTRPYLDFWKEKGMDLVVPVNPRTLLEPSLYPQLFEQAEYVGWLEVAQASANSA